jgi:polyhydroxybutyrate depolymerase
MQHDRGLRRGACLLAFVLATNVSGCCCAPVPVKPSTSATGTTNKTETNQFSGKVGTFPNEVIVVAGKPREYRLVVPKTVDPAKPVALVFAFHGAFDSKDLMPLYSQLDELASEKGFILVYPNGKNKSWVILPELAGDDLAFFDALYADLTAKYDVDKNRVYLTGMSNGAFFSHVVAAQRPGKIAAIAVHSGGLGFYGSRDINAQPKYAVLVIHGAADSIVSVEEGRKTRDAYKKWGHAVEYVEIPGHNHLWALLADVNHKIWDFFVAHPLR